MINHSLVSFLKSLSAQELRSFEDLVRSPYFNKKSAVIKLFNYLKTLYPYFNKSEKLDRKYIFSKIYPDKRFNHGVMKNIIYQLNILSEKFLETESYNKNLSDRYRHLLTELTQRNLNKGFRKNLKNAELELQKGKKSDVYFRNKMDIELIKFNFDIKNSGRTEKSIFDRSTGRLLVLYFLAKFFKINYNNLVHMLNFGKIEHIDFLDEVLSYMKRNPEIEPVINLYYHKFVLMYKEDDLSYKKFKQLVKEQSSNLERKELYNTFINLLNYCNTRIASGDSRYCDDVIEIYNEMNLNNIITPTESDYLDSILFRLAIESALSVKKFNWVEDFIRKHSKKLPPDLRVNEVNFAFANYFLTKKNYNEAQNHLAEIQLHSVSDKVLNYVLQCKLYYETKRFENLISEKDTILHFIAKDKILSKETKDKFRKFIKYLDQLIKFNTRIKNDFVNNVDKIKNELISEADVLDRSWLLEKINELSNH